MAGARYGNADVSLLPQFVQRAGRRLPKRLPGTLRHLILSIADRLPRFQERREFAWCELAEAFEVGTSGERPDADERHRLRRRKMVANPGEQLNQVQLVEQVVFEPQNQLVVRLVTRDRGAPSPQVVDRIQVGSLRPASESGPPAQRARSGRRPVRCRSVRREPALHAVDRPRWSTRPGMPAASIVIGSWTCRWPRAGSECVLESRPVPRRLRRARSSSMSSCDRCAG